MFESGIARVIVEFEKKYHSVFDKENNFIVVKTNKMVKEESTKTVLTMTHLEPWFYAYFIMITIAIFVFIVEMLMVWEKTYKAQKTEKKLGAKRNHVQRLKDETS